MNVCYEGPRRFVAPDREPKPVELALTPSRALPPGTAVSAVLGRSFRSVRTWTLDGVAATAGRVEVTRGIPESFEDAYRCRVPASYRNPPRQYRLATATAQETVPAGAELAFGLSGTLAEHAGVAPTMGVWLRWPGEDDPERVGEAVHLDNVAGEPAALEVRARPEPDPDGRHRVVVFAVDEATNPVPSFDETVALDSEGVGSLGGLPGTAVPDADGRVELELAVEGGPVRVAAETADGMAATGNALFAETPGAAGRYFGGIHFHTRHSHDGDRSVAGAYRYARDYLNLDAVAATDHTPGAAAWERTLEANEAFDDPGAFATIPAWEWSAVEGHANLYLRSADTGAGPSVAEPMAEPSYGHFDTDYGDAPTVHPTEVEWPADAVLVPHHTSAGDGDPWGWWDWGNENDRITAVEVVQRRGNFEADETDEEWGIEFAGRGASVQDALARGDRLGFVAGTDNHQGFPTVLPEGPTGLTCFAADARTREAVWDAMDARRTYATSGVPILCDYAVNGHPFGTEATLAGEAVAFSAELYGTAPIERVEVVSERETVWDDDPGERDVRIEDEPLPPPAGESTYYYLRLRQADGHRAWVSPVYLECE